MSQVRVANVEDLAWVKPLADQHAKDMGFVPVNAFLEAIDRGELLVVPEVAFCRYRKRVRDQFTTVYNFIYKDAAAADAMMAQLPKPLQCKVPEGTMLDAYMLSIGALSMGTFRGRRRELQAWLLLEGMGNGPRAAE